MTAALSYDDVEIDHVEAILADKGEVFISLPTNRASALVSLIKVIQVSQGWSKNHTPLRSRLAPFVKGMLVTLHISIRHSRLFDLGRVIVLNRGSQTWETLPDGNVLFRLSRGKSV